MSLAPAALALALAYAPPGTVLLRQYGVHRSETLPPRVVVGGTVSLWGDEAHNFAREHALPLAGDHLELAAKLELTPGRCTLSLGPDGRLLQLSNDGGKIQPDATLPAALTALVAEGCVPYLWRGETSEDALSAFIQGHGGSPREVSFTRFDGRVAYAIGGPASGAGKVAFVVSQESLTPLRLLLRNGAVLWDVRFGEYRSVVFGGGFPGRVSVVKDGLELASFAVEPPSR